MRSTMFMSALLILGAGGPSLAANTASVPPVAESDAVTAAEDSPAEASGAAMRAGFDRETGRFRQLTPEETEALRARVNERGHAYGLLRRAGLSQPETDAEAQTQAVTLADGSVITPVPMELMVSLEVRKDADGKLVMSHSDERLGEAHEGHAHTDKEVTAHE